MPSHLLKKPLHFYKPTSRTFLVSQLVKNLPAIQETWVRSLGWEDPLEKGKATHSSIKKVKVAQLGPTLCHPMNYTVHGIL